MAKGKRFKGIEPNTEQTRRFNYSLETLTEKGQVIGRVYRRQPLFETMYLRGEIDRHELQALRYYRERYELSHRSLTRSCLAATFGARGGADGRLSPLSSRAGQEVAIMEEAAGLFVHTFRALALTDLSFNKIAIERYGSQQVDVGGKPRIVPKSKQHTRRIKSEFQTALKCFLSAAQRLYSVNFSVDYPTHTRHKSNNGGNARVA